MEHTSVPWTIRPCECGHPCRQFFLHGPTLSDGRMFKADVLLAAAAPDLLAACKTLVKWAGSVSMKYMLQDAVLAAATAVIKAEKGNDNA